MDTGSIVLIIVATILVTATTVYILVSRTKNGDNETTNANGPTVQMQLQAYERLLILVDRIGLQYSCRHGNSCRWN